MADVKFYPGQRWVSNTESELGLGIVLSCVSRRVELEFPAAEEFRTYAIDNAPLSRILFEAGEALEDEFGNRFTVLSSVDNQHCRIYQVLSESGEELILPEQHIGSAVHFVKPQQRLFAGQIDRQAFFKLRVQTLEHLSRLDRSPVRGLLGARVELLPHQFHIAHRLASLAAPRALLADEVGLGKTIEAGLIIHQRLLTGRAKRVLICLPENLQHQWLVEMLRRFNLSFSLFDELRIQALLAEGDGNPFESAQQLICSVNLLTHNEQYLNWALEAGWDLLVVDEAHHIGWSQEQPSHAYRCIEALCETIPAVLLLTATPEHLGPEGHFARLRLLDPQRFNSLEQFLSERSGYAKISEQLLELEALGAAGVAESAGHLEFLREQLGSAEIERWLQGDTEQRDATFKRLIQTLVATRGPGAMMFRNTRDSVSGFPERCVHPCLLDAPEEFVEVAAEYPLIEQLRPEVLLGADWLEIDPRVEWLGQWLKEHRNKKVLLICAQAQTAVELENHLNLRLGLRSAVFHEGMSLVNRDRAAAYFADQELGAQILVCSEIGSEGRNFQFASDLVMFDLPLNPDLLEQRIGRLDRIGQRNRVEIHCPLYRDSAAEQLFNWLHSGVNAFEAVSKAGAMLYREFAESLLQALQSGDEATFTALIHDTRIKRQEYESLLTQGRDRLLELNSHPDQSDLSFIEAVLEVEDRPRLQGYAENLFDRFGLEMQPHGPNGWVIRPGEEMVAPLTSLDDDGMTITFDRQEALQREDIGYLSWEHPLLVELMEWVAASEFGNTSLCTLKLPALPPGTVLVECYYRVHLSAPRAWQMERFFERGLERFLIDPAGRDLGPHLAHEPLNKLAQTLSLSASQKMVRMIREPLVSQLQVAETLAEQSLSRIRSAAQARLEAEAEDRLQQLRVLADRGSDEAQQQISELQTSLDGMRTALTNLDLVPDALRVIVIGE